MILAYFKQIFKYFSEEKKPFVKYSCLSLVAGILELCGVALIYPFILKILQNKPSESIYTSSAFIGFLIIFIFLIKNLFMIFYTNIQVKYTNAFERKVQIRLMQYFLSFDYKRVSKISFAQKGKIFGLLIPNIMNNFVLRLLNLNINLFILCLLLGLIAVKFPLATIITTLFAITVITVQNYIYKPILIKTSRKVSDLKLQNDKRYNEAVFNIKEIKLANKEKNFYYRFEQAQKDFFDNKVCLAFLNQVPPYVTEPFVIILLFILLLVITIQTNGTPYKLVASFALIVSAIFRLAPTISRIQINLNGINTALPLVKEFIEIYETLGIDKFKGIQTKEFCNFKNTIELKNVNFSYDSKKPVLSSINLTIQKGEFIGIAGLSGSGKTTLIDIISALYKPDSGCILIDGKEEINPLKIGYIPQEFRLISGNIRENVAFGETEIDDNKVIAALKKAQLYDFIEENFEEGIYANPFVDSAGFSLGQRQRIAIARALYLEPDILILDEATSSLDNKTEEEICNVLNSLKGEKTIIAVAHRISTIKSADKILFMEYGTISDIGNYDTLLTSSKGFKTLVEFSQK